MKAFFAQEYRLIKPALLTPWPYVGTVAGAVWACLQFDSVTIVPLAIFAFLLSLQATVDVRTGYLPHFPQALLVALGFYYAPMLGIGTVSAGLALVILLLGFWGLSAMASKIAKRPALGGGDLLFAAAMAPWFGLFGIPPWLLAVAVLGVLWVILKRAGILKGKGSGGEGSFPFAPALALAGWLALVGQKLYWQCINFLVV